jgi:hypothetical protein
VETEQEDQEEGRRYTGKLVVVLIVGWTALLLFLGVMGVRRLQRDPCWDRGPGSPPLPAECHPK